MMTGNKLQILIKRFAVAAKAHYVAMEEMNAERAERQAVVISRLFEGIVREGAAGRDALLALTDNDNPAVAGMAAVYSMRYSPERCILTLRRLAAEEGLLGFRAAMALQKWEAGEWELD